MKIVIAPDSFKGSMTALEAARAIAAGIADVLPDAETVLVPLADGGEGTVDALVAAVPASSTKTHEVRGPLGGPVLASYGLLGESGSSAVVEMAAASGLTLVPDGLRDPMRASTHGTGELIRAALSEPGVTGLTIGLGGSATNDGGAGALAALGVRFFDEHGTTVEMPISPLNMADIAGADLANALVTDAEIVIACDVVNPLCGPNGATAVFGPQKGVTPEMVEVLDHRLAQFADVLDQIDSQRRAAAGLPSRSSRIADVPGGGAAGGLAAGLMALFPGARLQPGIDLVLDIAGFDRLIGDADLVICGEGRIDSQTLSGKTIAGILKRTKAQGKRTIALAGSVDPDAARDLRAHGLESAHALMELTDSVADAMSRGPELLRLLARQVMSP